MRRGIILVALGAAAALLIPLEWWLPGAACWLAALVLVLRDPEPAFRRRMGIVLGAVALLAAAPIHTARNSQHFVTLGLPFLAVVVVPALLMRRFDRGVLRFTLWPRRFRRRDLVYTLLAIPVSWLAIELYFFHINVELPSHWAMPQPPSTEAFWRLFAGINAVGIWDELFFVNTVFALLRSCYSFGAANLAQSVIYASVLTDMAFTGIGPGLVYLFALTQGAMYERSESLLWVLLVHVIVDAVLVAAILRFHYPGFVPAWF
jgi:membrane protease YdiL (CAAX protease family)